MTDFPAALAALNAQIANVTKAVTPGAPAPAPSPGAYQRPYQTTGHAPLTAPDDRGAAVPHPAPTGAFTGPGIGGTRITGRPATLAPEPIDVPTSSSGNPLSALQTPPVGAVHLNRLDLATPAGPTLATQLGNRAPSGVPLRDQTSHTIPTGYGPGGAR